jgi:hypothetical protein
VKPCLVHIEMRFGKPTTSIFRVGENGDGEETGQVTGTEGKTGFARQPIGGGAQVYLN